MRPPAPPAAAGLSARGLVTVAGGPYDLTVEPGACVSLRGPSGAGKTLLLRALADLDPHRGEVWLDGVRCEAMSGPAWRRRVMLVPAESGWWRDRVGDHFPPRAGAELLERVGLPAAALGWPVARLSSGERQRAALARALAFAPRALLLDEPTASLDSASAARVEALIAAYRTERGAPVVWVSHDAAQAARVAARHLWLVGGRLTEVAA